MIFNDEKIFIKNGYFSRKTHVIQVGDRSDANIHGVLHSMEKYSVCVIVVVGATSHGLTRPYFFSKRRTPEWSQPSLSVVTILYRGR